MTYLNNKNQIITKGYLPIIFNLTFELLVGSPPPVPHDEPQVTFKPLWLKHILVANHEIIRNIIWNNDKGHLHLKLPRICFSSGLPASFHSPTGCQSYPIRCGWTKHHCFPINRSITIGYAPQIRTQSLICLCSSSSFPASCLTARSLLFPSSNSEQLWVLEGSLALPRMAPKQPMPNVAKAPAGFEHGTAPKMKACGCHGGWGDNPKIHQLK